MGERRCALSGDSVAEIVEESDTDFVVCALRVQRAECAIDAPATMRLEDVVVGVYSFEAFVEAQKFALQHNADAHDADAGYFKAADGRRMNCCLPLFLSDAHWRRVARSLPPLLGHAFALDALAFNEDQVSIIFFIYVNIIYYIYFFLMN